MLLRGCSHSMLTPCQPSISSESLHIGSDSDTRLAGALQLQGGCASLRSLGQNSTLPRVSSKHVFLLSFYGPIAGVARPLLPITSGIPGETGPQ